MELMEHQKKAVEELSNGKILYGVVGTGKSIAAMAYYMKEEAPKNVYVITTAKKRDELDWMREAAKFGVGITPETSVAGVLTVDSWHNIRNYTEVEDAFFIFDEQRLVGHGAWVKAFLKIAKENNWILLSGTPGDTWLDYAPVFIANGYYKNITDFKRKHVMYEPFSRYPRIKMYLNERKLESIRNHILVEMPFIKHTNRVLNWMDVDHDKDLLKRVWVDRWHIYEDRPIHDMAEVFRVMRRLVNSDPSRLDMILKLLKSHDRLIIFYNFNYELDLLRTLEVDVPVYEYNGHKKDPLPESDRWVYLVQYVAGAEGWNCTTTNATVLYSLTYSFKNFEQCQGRTDRLNTPYTDLFYYILMSNSVPDLAIKRALDSKENFNERKFVDEMDEFGVWDEDIPGMAC